MGKRELLFLLACSLTLLMFEACSKKLSPLASENEQIVDNSTPKVYFKVTTAEALAENGKDHEVTGDYSWDNSKVIQIVLKDYAITVNGAGVTVNGGKATITSAGTYSMSGTLTDGQIIVNSKAEGVVKLIMNGITMTSTTSAPLFIKNAEKAVIVLADNSENDITDGVSYVFDNSEEDEPNAAIFSKENLTICGNGSLTVDGNYNDGIASKDGLIIKSGAITVSSADDGIRGKDYLIVKDGKITVNAKGDGLKSDNDSVAAMGYVLIGAGTIDVTSGGDAITAGTDVMITGGKINVTSGGGSSFRGNTSISAKGIKGAVNTIIDYGTITINSADDAIHSNKNLAINGGSIEISSGDDGIHADSSLGINGGDFSIKKSYEGIESRRAISISDGDIHIVSSDDGLNIASGNEGGGMPPGQGGFTVASNRYLYINGGAIVVNAVGDGFDINGSIVMTGGDVIINGPTSDMNGALDYDASFKITGGFLVAAGSSGMAQAPGTSSTQYSVLIRFNSTQQAGALFHIQTSGDNEILSFSPAKQYRSIAFSSSKLKKGSTYDVYLGGSSTGATNDGLYQNGTYSAGTKFTGFTISAVVTNINR